MLRKSVIALELERARWRPIDGTTNLPVTMRHPLDFSLVAVTLWLLVSMIIDVLTPKWLTVYMIGAALAPMMLAGIILRILHWRRQQPPGRKKSGRLPE